MTITAAVPRPLCTSMRASKSINTSVQILEHKEFCHNLLNHMSRKTVFRTFYQVRHKPSCTATEDSKRLEIFHLGSRKDCTIREVKTKALSSLTVTAELICAFVFAYAKSWFSHDAAHKRVVGC